MLLGITILVLFSAGADGYAAQKTLVWDDHNEPGTIAGYYVYCGNSSGNYQVVYDVSQNKCVFTNLQEGKVYYFAVKAYRSTGEESAFSAELVYAVPVSNSDTDGDGINDFDEINRYGTDPQSADTDNDGLNDGEELAFWGNAWSSDWDGDGVINLLDSDSDNDGVIDGMEAMGGNGPNFSNNNPTGPVEFALETGEG